MVMSSASAAAELATYADFDLDRYLGRWHQIALLPNRFQAKCVSNTTATYSLEADGKIQVVNECRTDNGDTVRVQGQARKNSRFNNPARLEVRFAPRWLSWLSPVWGDYWVLDVDEDYQLALVGSPDKKYLWILARQPQITEAEFTRVKDLAKSAGFAVQSLKLESPNAVITK